ncbi:NTF2 [Pyrrhoderma noxium]|uniref:NTF2 n=1 Tax=Pyrrhoderma noxium TaxID=2282107 RepID=A0A286UAV6_9AGAM|nr:NTF2 [Pyrrhoderma noxium]
MASTSSRPSGLATRTLKATGLIREQDATMRDASRSTPLRRKQGKKVGHRQRTMDLLKSSGTSDLSNKMTKHRLTGTLSNPSLFEVLPIDKLVPRYDPASMFLNLENLADDELLKRNNIVAPGQPGANHKEFPVIFKLASQLQPPVETISLANNNISAGTHLVPLSHYLPQIRNLSLQDNKIKSWRDVEYIAGTKTKKLSVLRELIFIGNPLRESEVNSNKPEHYKSGMLRRFPSLEVLDQEVITKISFDAPVASSSSDSQKVSGPDFFPFQMAPSFITGVDGSVISGFLSRFFPLFDTDRTALADVYDPGMAYIQRYAQPAKAGLGPWIKNPIGGSRNLSAIKSGLERELRSLHTGPEEIIRTISHLPGTNHAVAGAAEKFCIDAWPVGTGAAAMLFLCVHGEFSEAPSMGVRSFDRSFLLAPAVPGSRAAAASWPMSILSDQLTVRPYSSPEAWKPGPLSTQNIQNIQNNTRTFSKPVPSTPLRPARHVPIVEQKLANPAVQSQLAAIPDPQRSLIVSLCQRTSMNVKFAIDCLQNNEWDVDRAFTNFEQVKATLGDEAFL